MDYTGQKVIIRGDRSGVFFGILREKNGQEIVLDNCRRLWYWSGAASLTQLAAEGVKNPQACKFTMRIDSITILDAIEILLCTPQAVENIESVNEWKQ
jgi:hypothetical protein